MKILAPSSPGRAVAAALALAAVVTATTASTALASLSQTADSTTPQTNGRVHVIMRVDGVVYVGGSFSSVRPAGDPLGTGEMARANAFAFAADTGQILPWKPDPNGVVRTMVANPSGSEIFLGGNFTTVGGNAHGNLAAVAACVNHAICQGAVQPWHAYTSGGVYGLAAQGNTLYVGGNFKRVNNVPHPNLGAVTLVGGRLIRTFAPSGPDGAVHTVLLSPGRTRLFVGGAFHHVGSSAQRNFAAVSATSGRPGPWRSYPPYGVLSLAETPTTLYVGGGGGGGHMRSYRITDGRLHLQTVTNGNVQSVSMYHGEVLTVGHFTTWGGVSHKHMALINGTTGHVDPNWAPFANMPLGGFAGLGYGQQAYVGGDFTTVNGQPQQSLATFSDTQADTTAPTITRAPDVRMATGTTFGTTLPVTLSWAGTDDLSGICRYMVQQKAGSGAFAAIVPPFPTALSMPRSLTPNVTYTFNAAAKDCSDNVSSTIAGPTATVAVVQNSNGQLHYHGRWTRNHHVRGTSKGTISYTTRKYANVEFDFNGRQIAWVASKSTNRGRAWVYVDGHLSKVVDLHASRTERRQIVYTRAFSVNGPHRIRIFNQATRGRPVIDVDAFVLVR